MSLEIKRIVEVDTDPFVPADPEQVKGRITKQKQVERHWKKVGKEAVGKGPEAWRGIPEEYWPEVEDEDICLVCGEADLEYVDFEDDTQIMECNNCGAEIAQDYYQPDPVYDSSRVLQLPKPGTSKPVTEEREMPEYDSEDEEDEDERLDREMFKKGFLPVDEKAAELAQEYYRVMQDLDRYLGELSRRNGSDKCECSQEVLDYFGQGLEDITIPTDENSATTYCLRCGGYVEF